MHSNDSRLSGAAEYLGTEQGLRRLPSRKDLQKQQKLVKRVSDLEGKLEAARRQLAESMGEPVPMQTTFGGRYRFIPSTLATLPSESLLAAQATLETMSGNAVTGDKIGRAVSTDEKPPAIDKIPAMHRSTRQSLKAHTTTQLAPASLEKPLPPAPSIANQETRGLVLDMPESSVAEKADVVVEEGTQALKDLKIPKQRLKKRKSIGIGIADDGGRYKPSPESDEEEDAELSKHSRKEGYGRLAKQQKIRHEEGVVYENMDKSEYKKRPLTPGRTKLRKVREPETKLNRGDQCQKPNPTTSAIRSQGPTSPPPGISDHFVNNSKKGGFQERDTQSNSTALSSGAHPPPVPELPRTVRLASGELVHVGLQKKAEIPPGTERSESGAGEEEASAQGGDIKEKGMKSKGSFEWPADIF